MQVGALFSKYRLDRLLSQDVMGEVWAAVDTSSRQPVVVRALPEEAAEDFYYRDRFEREAEIASRINSPNVVPVIDFGQIGNRLFRVSPLVAGTNLWRRLESAGPMPAQQAVDVVTQMATALQAVQAAGLTNQEVASANVIVRDDGRVLLAEVGLPTNAGNASGVYGLTTVLYECLTGTAFPWSNREPLRPSAAVPGVPAEFDAVVARGTALAPVERYRSVSEFVIAASDAAGASRPLRAATAAGSTAAAARNRKVLIGASAAAAVVLIAVVSGLLIGSGSSSDVARVVTSSAQPAAPTTTARQSPSKTAPSTTRTTDPTEAAVPDSDSGEQQGPTSVPVLPSGAPSPVPGAPQVFACDPGYVHTPPPDGPCWAPNAGAPPPGLAQVPPAPVPAAPGAPEILPCYPGYVHTPPPDGPCWAPG